MASKLIFVYNADSGFANAMVDMAHKFFSPGTYSCNLCQLTYSAFGMRDRWRNFLASLGQEMEFLHRDEFRIQADLPSVDLPAIFIKRDGEVSALVHAEQLNSVGTLEDLMALVQDKLKES